MKITFSKQLRLGAHLVLIFAEVSVLCGIIAIQLTKNLSTPYWVFSDKPQILRFCFSGGQQSLLDKFSQVGVYYATWQDPVLSERQRIILPRQTLHSETEYLFELPERVSGFRLDFGVKNRNMELASPPKLQYVILGDSPISSGDLLPFTEEGYKFCGYRYMMNPFLNGWGWIVIAVTVVIALAVTLGCFCCLKHGEP